MTLTPTPPLNSPYLLSFLIAAVLAGLPGGLVAQDSGSDRVRTTPQGRYEANAVKRLLLGGGHRSLWSTPVDATVLDLDTFAGGLTVLREGGGLQTRSLRFQGEDGQVWNFRSLDKDATRSLDPELRATIAASVMQDRISALLPLSAMVVAPLLEAADVLHADPTLVVLPDSPRLGEFRERFAGLLGWIEVRPDEGPDGEPGFAGALQVVGSDRLLERVEGRPHEYVDALAFLRARLMDVYVGDWDRHPDQWRWAGFENGRSGDRTVVRFEPVPRDRDWALSRLDGLVGRVSWAFWPHYVGFAREFPNAFRATWSARVLDRRFLSELTSEDFSRVARELQTALTDEVIEASIDRLPDGYREQVGEELRTAFYHRREDLPRFAREWYDLLAGWVDVHSTDDDEQATVEWTAEGGAHVRIEAVEDEPSRVVFERRFSPDETREVRVYLHGGDDQLVIQGERRGRIHIHVVGGGGDDQLRNSTAHGGGGVSFYDHRGDNEFEVGPGARVDVEEFEEPFDPSETTHQAPFRDWGARWLPLPTLSYDADLGVFLGFGGIRTGYGFRSYPHSTRLDVSAGFGTEPGHVRGRLRFDFPVWGSLRGELRVLASGAEVRRFHGFGNDTRADRDEDFYDAEQTEVMAALPVGLTWGQGREFRVGPVVRHFSPRNAQGTLADSLRPVGYGSFTEVGALASFAWDARDRVVNPTQGWTAEFEARLFPALADVETSFAGARGQVTGFATVPGRLGPTLMASVGGERLSGTIPFQEAAYLGGAATLRGYRNQRFAGDGSVFLRSELRWKLGSLQILLPEDVGLFLLADAGRVFVDDESSDSWHTAVGGGVWLSLMDVLGVNISMARSDEGSLFYVTTGFSFGS